MAIHLAWPLGEFRGFLERQRINTERLGKILRDVKDKRNRAAHEVAPWGGKRVPISGRGGWG
jgi:hypothetical protein